MKKFYFSSDIPDEDPKVTVQKLHHKLLQRKASFLITVFV